MLKKMLRSSIAPVLLFVLAAGLIGYGGIKAVQAAPRIQSEVWGAQVQLSSIETALVENDVIVPDDGELLGPTFVAANELSEDYSDFKVGKKYTERLAVQNVGAIDQYVRVTVYKYWADSEGNVLDKRTDLKPEYIELNFPSDTGWNIDNDASTEERTVLYYSGIAEEETDEPTSIFMDSITISPKAAKVITSNEEYKYNGVYFHIKATVDAVQTHNGQEAMTGAWGRTN